MEMTSVSLSLQEPLVLFTVILVALLFCWVQVLPLFPLPVKKKKKKRFANILQPDCEKPKFQEPFLVISPGEA